MSSKMSGEFTGGQSRITVSDVSRRLQIVGTGVLEKGGLRQIGESTFSTHDARTGDLGKRLLRARDRGVPLIEVEAVGRDDEFSDQLFDAFRLDRKTRLILEIARSTGQEGLNYSGQRELRIDSVGLSIPGSDEISLTGEYGTEIKSVLTSTGYDGYEMKGQRNKYGKRILPGYGSSYSYEDDNWWSSGGERRMHALLDEIKERFDIREPNTAGNPSKLAIAWLKKLFPEKDITSKSGLSKPGAGIGDKAITIQPESTIGAETMEEEVFYREGTGYEVKIDPATLNLDKLPLVLAMAGWTALINYPENEGGEIDVSLIDSGGSGGRTGMEIALELNMLDSGTGELLSGFRIEEESGRLTLKYVGIANMRFAEFTKALYNLSPFKI